MIVMLVQAIADTQGQKTYSTAESVLVYVLLVTAIQTYGPHLEERDTLLDPVESPKQDDDEIGDDV